MDKIDISGGASSESIRVWHKISSGMGYEATNVGRRGLVGLKEYENVGLPLDLKAIGSITRGYKRCGQPTDDS